MANAETRDLHPQQPIRRFDVFAEYTRQERREKGYPEDESMAHNGPYPQHGQPHDPSQT